MRRLMPVRWFLPVALVSLLLLLRLPQDGVVLAFTSSRSDGKICFQRNNDVSMLFLKKSNKGDKASSTNDNLQLGDTRSATDIRNHPAYDRFAAFLAAEIGLTDPAKVKKIAERSPTVVAYSEAALKERFDFFRDLFKYSNDELQRIVYNMPIVLSFGRENLKAKILKLSEILQSSVGMDQLGYFLWKMPTILSVNPERNLKPKVEYLRERVFQDDNDAMIMALTNNPSVLTLSLDNRIIPRTDVLLAAGINPSIQFRMSYKATDNEFRTWFEKQTKSSLPDDFSFRNNPVILSIEERAQERIALLSTNLEMTYEEACYLLNKTPAIHRISVDFLDEKIQYFLELYGGSKQMLKAAIYRFPSLLMCSSKKVATTATYLLKEVFDGEKEAFLSCIVTYPTILAYSLDARIKPRIQAAQNAGLNLRDISIGSMMKQADDHFSIWLSNRMKTQLKNELW